MEEQDYNEFRNTVTKNRGIGKKKAKVSHSWGVYDAYKHIRKNGWYDIGRPLKEHEFYTIVREVNRLLADNLALGETVVFPSRMGKLELRKHEVGVSFVNGVLKNTYPIDWNETIRLWYEDKEAMEKRMKVRDEQKCIYRIKYCKYDATYENKIFYQFTLNRFVRRALKKNIKKGITDTLW